MPRGVLVQRRCGRDLFDRSRTVVAQSHGIVGAGTHLQWYSGCPTWVTYRVRTHVLKLLFVLSKFLLFCRIGPSIPSICARTHQGMWTCGTRACKHPAPCCSMLRSLLSACTLALREWVSLSLRTAIDFLPSVSPSEALASAHNFSGVFAPNFTACHLQIAIVLRSISPNISHQGPASHHPVIRFVSNLCIPSSHLLILLFILSPQAASPGQLRIA